MKDILLANLRMMSLMLISWMTHKVPSCICHLSFFMLIKSKQLEKKTKGKLTKRKKFIVTNVGLKRKGKGN